MKRTCGECSACCWIGAVREGVVQKDAHQSCRYDEGGCSLHGRPNRPAVCSTFSCLWLRGLGDDDGRPDRSGVMLTSNTLPDGSWWIFATETRLDAYRHGIVAQAARKAPVPLIVVLAKSKPPHDTGDLVVHRSGLAPRVRRMIGEELEPLADDVLVNRLKAVA